MRISAIHFCADRKEAGALAKLRKAAIFMPSAGCEWRRRCTVLRVFVGIFDLLVLRPARGSLVRRGLRPWKSVLIFRP